jgi:hypothetical protein
MFLDQKDECTGDFIYTRTQAGFAIQRRGADGRGVVVEGAQLPRGFLHNNLQDNQIWADDPPRGLVGQP